MLFYSKTGIKNRLQNYVLYASQEYQKNTFLTFILLILLYYVTIKIFIKEH